MSTHGTLADDLGHQVHFSGLRGAAPVTLSKLDGWIGGVEVRGDRIGRLSHGIFPPVQRLEPRRINLGGSYTGEDANEVARVLGAICAPVESGDEAGLLTITDHDGWTLSCRVHRDGGPRIDYLRPWNRVEFELPLLAPDPRLYGPQLSMQVLDLSSVTGFEWPAFPDGVADWGGVVTGAGDAIHNPGTYPAHPVFTIEGTWPGGFAVGFGPYEVEYSAPVSGVPVVVDFAGSVLINGVDRMQHVGFRRWGAVQPGESVVPYFRPTSGGSGVATCRMRPAWL